MGTRVDSAVVSFNYNIREMELEDMTIHPYYLDSLETHNVLGSRLGRQFERSLSVFRSRLRLQLRSRLGRRFTSRLSSHLLQL